MADELMDPSILLRIRRVTYEDSFVAVPVTEGILKMEKDGTYKLDIDAFVAEALRISNDQRVEWKFESTQKEAHPIQMPKPEDRQLFDAYYLQTEE
jgi:hypothetical protein